MIFLLATKWVELPSSRTVRLMAFSFIQPSFGHDVDDDDDNVDADADADDVDMLVLKLTGTRFFAQI